MITSRAEIVEKKTDIQFLLERIGTSDIFTSAKLALEIKDILKEIEEGELLLATRVRAGCVDLSEEEWERSAKIMFRTNGDIQCEACARPYWRHLRISFKGEVIPTVHLTCTGQYVKL